MKLQDMMVKPVIQASPEESVSDAAKRMRETGVGCLVVTSADVIKGIVTDRDLLTCLAHSHDPRRCQVSLHMHRPVFVLAPEEDHAAAIKVLRRRKIKRLPVARGGKLLGIITLSDLAALAVQEALQLRSSWDFFAEVLTAQSAQGDADWQAGRRNSPIAASRTAAQIQTAAKAMDTAA